MKKIFAVLCALSLAFFASGCSKNVLDGQLPKLETKIEKDVKITSENEEYECKLFHTPEGLTTLTFTCPDTLKDFTISRSGGEFKINKSGLEAEYVKDPLPKDSAIKCLMDILSIFSSDERNFSFKKSEEGEKTYEGNVENRECEVVLNDTGEIIRICMHNPEVEFEFIS